ncbi:hypothetical protein AMST5_00083 [freshwater sediment metagenome]|uniref:SsuA/THI5-like domain-containing protein n=1 Tax=freshwater sediment metagenome TaxID=556182 RepID=A0AA48LZ26_9ZZZZ
MNTFRGLLAFATALLPFLPPSFAGDTISLNKNVNIAKVRVGYLPMVSSLAYFVATYNHYFVDEKLDVDANYSKTSDTLAQDLVSNNIDVVIELSIVPLLQTLDSSGSAKFRIFSVSRIDASNGFDGVLVKGSSTATDLSGLSSRRVAVFPGTTARDTFAAVFSAQYPSLRLPQFDNTIRPSDQLNALLRGDIDAIHAYEPFLTVGQKRFGFKRLYGSIYAAQLTPNPIGVAAVSESFIATNRDATTRFLRAMNRAVEYIRSHPDESRDILSKYTHADSDVARDMAIMPMSLTYEIDKANLNRYLELLHNMNQYRFRVQADRICLDDELAERTGK